MDNGIDAVKTTSKKLIDKAAGTTGEYTGKKFADKIVKPSRNVEEIIIPQEKRNEIFSELRQVL